MINSNQNKIILGLNPGIFGLNYHDPSACLINKGIVVAAVEENKCRGEKRTMGVFPFNAIKECLKLGKITFDKINSISVSYDLDRLKERQDFLTLNKLNSSEIATKDIVHILLNNEILKTFGEQKPIYYINHHLCHAALTYFYSGFKKTLILVCDGIGEINTLSLYKIEKNDFEIIYEETFP